MNKTDIQLKREIETELGWDPKVNAAQIGVSVDQAEFVNASETAIFRIL